MPPALLYLRSLWRYTIAVIIIIIIIIIRLTKVQSEQVSQSEIVTI